MVPNNGIEYLNSAINFDRLDIVKCLIEEHGMDPNNGKKHLGMPRQSRPSIEQYFIEKHGTNINVGDDWDSFMEDSDDEDS
jgi:hypothetical protein